MTSHPAKIYMKGQTVAPDSEIIKLGSRADHQLRIKRKIYI